VNIYIASDGNEFMLKNNPPPHVPLGLAYYIDAFMLISSDRQQGSMPFTSILQYAQFKGLKDVDQFITIMQIMDTTFLRESRKLNERQDHSATNEMLKNRAAAHGVR